MAKSVKGNPKGTTQSYHMKRLMWVAGISIVFLVILAVSSSFSLDDNSNSMRKSADARVSATGDVENIADDADNRFISLHKTPLLKYGTAWKKDRTAEYVYNAIVAGFRHVDTACQPKHYNEAQVGEGWKRAAAELNLDRSDVWLQTKYTSVSGQDPNNIPYDQTLPLDEQVRVSFRESLKNLQTPYLDSWIMHGPEDSWDDNLLVWRTMESFVEIGVVRQIGISNFYDLDAIEYLYKQAKIKPSVVQNRFYPDSGYDVLIRRFCLDHDIEYQSFWTLGANRHALESSEWKRMAVAHDLTPETLMYALCMTLDMTPLDGTTSLEHLQQDVSLVRRMQNQKEELLSEEEVDQLSDLLGIPDEEESSFSSGDDSDDEEEENVQEY